MRDLVLVSRLPRHGIVCASLLVACQPSGIGSFTTEPLPPASTSTSGMVDPSTSSGPGGSPSTSGGSSNGTTASSESGASSGSSSGPIFDMGVKDLGDDTPPGCKGKIDFLFVISRSSIMEQSQAKMIAAFPKFMATIEAKFADFDYHVMVIDGDEEWGLSYCSEDCPVLDCKVGDPCCPVSICPGCDPPNKVGDPCCATQDYPCDLLDLVTECDLTMGAGNVFAAGAYAANEPCKMPEPGRRYLVSGDPDLTSTFACMAQLGIDGRGLLGEAMTIALYPEINAPGGCNEGFLRKDALLMITFIGESDYDSKGEPATWAGTITSVKGDPGAVVLLEFLTPDCPPQDRICEMIKMFPYHMAADIHATDFAPIFDAATELVATACDKYVPM